MPTEINEYVAEPLNCKSSEASVSVERLKKRNQNRFLDIPEIFQ